MYRGKSWLQWAWQALVMKIINQNWHPSLSWRCGRLKEVIHLGRQIHLVHIRVQVHQINHWNKVIHLRQSYLAIFLNQSIPVLHFAVEIRCNAVSPHWMTLNPSLTSWEDTSWASGTPQPNNKAETKLNAAAAALRIVSVFAERNKNKPAGGTTKKAEKWEL